MIRRVGELRVPISPKENHACKRNLSKTIISLTMNLFSCYIVEEYERTFIHYKDKDVKTDNDVRDRILEEAIRLFLKNGFRGTSVKDLTEAVGIARGTLYCHFKSKDEVLESILEKYSREFLDQLMATIDNCKADFMTKFRTFFRFTTEFARDNRELLTAYNTLIGEIIGNNSDAEKKIREMQAKFNLFVENLVTYGQGEGTVSKEIDAHTHSHVITATLSGCFFSGMSIRIHCVMINNMQGRFVCQC
jgi:AcrR family transcriptional regulator